MLARLWPALKKVAREMWLELVDGIEQEYRDIVENIRELFQEEDEF